LNTDITNKSYKKLSILVSLNGFSFTITDLISGKPKHLKNIHFDSFQKSTNIEELYANVFNENPELSSKYDEIVIIHSNNLSTFVPVALFDESYLGSYLQYNTKVFETDFFTFDKLEKYEMNNVYIPYVNMNNYFIDQFGTFDYKHANTILVSKLLDLSKNNDNRKMFVHKSENHFEIIVIQNQKLQFFNTFEFKTPEDFIYYILFSAEQLHLNPEHFALELFGDCMENDDYFKIAYKYIRNVNLLDVSSIFNEFSFEQNREHFILLNS
jgi:hypothetical protein